jgi:ketosteroid isomerase-like protein
LPLFGLQSAIRNQGDEMKSIVKCLACLLLLLSFASIFLLGQADSTQSDLIAAENSWNRAELVHDAAGLSRLMANDLVLTETDGSVINKSEEVAFTADPDTHFEILESHDMKVQVHGDAAVVTGAYHEKGAYHGKAFEHRGRYTDTWIRHNGSWQCIAGHFSIPVQD